MLMVVTIVLRVFPSSKEGRRASFVSTEVKLNKDQPVTTDIFVYASQVSSQTHKLARGISFLKPDELIQEGDVINAIPL